MMSPIKCATLFLFGVLNTAFSEAQQRHDVVVNEQHQELLSSASTYALGWRVMEAAAEHADIQLVTKGLPIKGVLNRLRDGRPLLAYGLAYSDERAQWGNFGPVLSYMQSSLYTYPENPLERIGDINPQALIAVSANSVQHQKAIDMGFENIYPVTDIASLGTMIVKRRIKYMLIADSSMAYYCQMFATKMPCIKPVGKPLIRQTVHFVVTKGHAKGDIIKERLSEGVKDFSQSPEALTLFKHHGFDESMFSQWQQTLDNPDTW